MFHEKESVIIISYAKEKGDSMKNDYFQLQEQLVFPMYLCSKEVIRKYSLLLDEIDLTYTQFIVMLYFWERKSSNVKDLGNTILLDSSTLTPLLKKLEKKGLITRTKSSVDERNLVLELTQKGKNLKKKAMDIPAKMAEICNLEDEEIETLRKILYKLLVNIEEKIKNEHN